MTDKEIIIDGVDVSKCSRLIVNKLYGYVCNCEEDEHLISSCKNRPNCYFKQLSRKTTECEELKKKLNTSEEWRIKAENLNEKQDLENTRYRKALDEIERICLEDVRILADGTELRYDSLDDILDIINKLKGGNDE